MVQLQPTDRRRRLVRAGILTGVVAVAAAFAFLPWRSPYHLQLQGRILPQREWMVTRDTGGRLTALLYDHRNGQTESYLASQFDREDAVHFALRPALRGARVLAKGDTVGEAVSNQVDQQWALLQGQLSTEQATLNLYLSGEKASVVEEAQQRVRYAIEQVEAQQKVVNRMRTLAERNAASGADLEIEESRLALFETEIEIARATLLTVSTGARPQEIQLVRSRIASLQSQIEALGRRVSNFTLISPISGLLIPTGSMDTLLAVADTSGLVVMIPISLAQQQHVHPGQSFRATYPGGVPLSGHIVRIEPFARRINGRQIVLATGTLEAKLDGRFVPGMRISVRIEGEPITLRQRFIRWFTQPAGAF